MSRINGDWTPPAGARAPVRGSSVSGLLGEGVRDEGIGVTMAQPVLGLEPVHELHVLGQGRGVDEVLPLCNRATVLLLDGREVAGRAFHGGGHVSHPVCPLCCFGVVAGMTERHQRSHRSTKVRCVTPRAGRCAASPPGSYASRFSERSSSAHTVLPTVSLSTAQRPASTRTMSRPRPNWSSAWGGCASGRRSPLGSVTAMRRALVVRVVSTRKRRSRRQPCSRAFVHNSLATRAASPARAGWPQSTASPATRLRARGMLRGYGV